MRYVAIYLALSGCCVCPITHRPYAFSQLVDARTGHPVAGAVIHAETVRAAAPGLAPIEVVETQEARSDAQGRFFLEAQVRWQPVLLLLPEAVPVYLTRYAIRAPGYAPLLLDPFATTPPEEIAWPRQVGLEPQGEAQRSR